MLLNLREPDANYETFSCDDLLAYGKRRWRRVQFVADQFWKLWQKSYLQSLQTRQKWTTTSTNVKIGDIVLLREKNAKRNTWPLARIKNVKLSIDGKVRSADVEVARGYGEKIKKLVYTRPVSEMVMLIEG